MATVTNLFEQRERKAVQLARALWATHGSSMDLFEQLRIELTRIANGAEAADTFARIRLALGTDTGEQIQYGWALAAALSTKIHQDSSWVCAGVAVRVPATEVTESKVRSLRLSTNICSAIENLMRESFGSPQVVVCAEPLTAADVLKCGRRELVAFGDAALHLGAASADTLRHEYDDKVPAAPVSGSTISRASAILMVAAIVSGTGSPRPGLLSSRSLELSSALKNAAAAGVLEAMRANGYGGNPELVNGVAASTLFQALQGGEEVLANMFLMGLRTRNARLNGMVMAKHERRVDGALGIECLKGSAVVERYAIKDRMQACGMSSNLGNLATAVEKIPFDVLASPTASNAATV